jgi:hypothetical protein
MSAGTVKGKALLVITRREDCFEGFCWDISCFIQSCSGNEDARDWVKDEFGCVEYDTHPAPSPAYQMEIGETIRVSVVYVLDHWTDYWGEGSSRLEYTKWRVLRRQKPKERYISKAQRAKERT